MEDAIDKIARRVNEVLDDNIGYRKSALITCSLSNVRAQRALLHTLEVLKDKFNDIIKQVRREENGL